MLKQTIFPENIVRSIRFLSIIPSSACVLREIYSFGRDFVVSKGFKNPQVHSGNDPPPEVSEHPDSYRQSIPHMQNFLGATNSFKYLSSLDTRGTSSIVQQHWHYWPHLLSTNHFQVSQGVYASFSVSSIYFQYEFRYGMVSSSRYNSIHHHQYNKNPFNSQYLP